MTKCKTLEEYLLNDFYLLKEKLNETLKELDEANSRVEEANIKIKELKDQQLGAAPKETEMKCIYLSEQPNYYYRVSTESPSYWNRILAYNRETPELVENALKDKESFKKLCELATGFDGPIAKIYPEVYNYCVQCLNQHSVLIVLTKENVYTYIVGKDSNNFLTQEAAEEYLQEKLTQDIKYYLSNYKEKFEQIRKELTNETNED